MDKIAVIGTIVHRGNVRPEWIDINDHMNVAYYILAFDYGVDALWDRIGVTDDYINNDRGSTFAVECHVTYQKELRKDDPYIVTSQLLGFDEKRIHQFQRLYHGDSHYLAATAEWMTLHVSLETRRVAPWPAGILERMHEVALSQAGQSRPKEAGKQISISSPLYSLGDEGE
jgi:acyl-CoA thioester hydrolase